MGNRVPLSHSVNKHTFKQLNTKLEDAGITRYQFFKTCIDRLIKGTLNLTGADAKTDELTTNLKHQITKLTFEIEQKNQTIEELKKDLEKLDMSDPEEGKMLKRIINYALKRNSGFQCQPLNAKEVDYGAKVITLSIT